MTKKGIVFCNTCHEIVGDSFPVFDHHHSINLENETLMNNLHLKGFQFIEDTPKNRKYLIKHFPPRKEVTIKL